MRLVLSQQEFTVWTSISLLISNWCADLPSFLSTKPSLQGVLVRRDSLHITTTMTSAFQCFAFTCFSLFWKESQAVVASHGNEILDLTRNSISSETEISERELISSVSCVAEMDAEAFVAENDQLCFPLLSEVGKEERGSFCLEAEDNPSSLKFTFVATGAWTLMRVAVWGHELPSTYPQRFGSPNSEEFPIGSKTPVGAITYSNSRPLNDFVQVEYDNNETTVVTQILATATVENLFDFGAAREIEQVWAHQEWLAMVTKHHASHFYSHVQIHLPNFMSECTYLEDEDESSSESSAPSSMPSVYPSSDESSSKNWVQDILFHPLAHLPNMTEKKEQIIGESLTGGNVVMVNATEVVVGIAFTIVHGYKNGVIGSAYKEILADAFNEFTVHIMNFEELVVEEEMDENSNFDRQTENALRDRKLLQTNYLKQRKLFVEFDTNSTTVYEFLSPETCPVEVKRDTENCHSGVARFTLLVSEDENVDEICKYYLETTAGALEDNILYELVRERLDADHIRIQGRILNATVQYCGPASRTTNTTQVIAKPKSQEEEDGGFMIDLSLIDPGLILLVIMLMLFCLLKISLCALSCASIRDKFFSKKKGSIKTKKEDLASNSKVFTSDSTKAEVTTV